MAHRLPLKSVLLGGLLLSLVLTTACGAKAPETAPVRQTSAVGAMASLSSGGFIYGDSTTGEVWQVDRSGQQTEAPLITLSVSTGPGRGVVGLVVDNAQNIYASWTDPDGRLIVGRIAPAEQKIIWNGPRVGTANIGGRLTLTPGGRLLVAVGDQGEPERAASADAFNGKLLTLDPNATFAQQPNPISKGWTNPLAIAYDRAGSLWVGDEKSGKATLSRAAQEGSTGHVTNVGDNEGPVAMTAFGDKELVMCNSTTGLLQRFLIDNAEAVAGRTITKDCTKGVTELSDGRIAYATNTEIRVTKN